jgi:hypothetical protein
MPKVVTKSFVKIFLMIKMYKDLLYLSKVEISGEITTKETSLIDCILS